MKELLIDSLNYLSNSILDKYIKEGKLIKNIYCYDITNLYFFINIDNEGIYNKYKKELFRITLELCLKDSNYYYNILNNEKDLEDYYISYLNLYCITIDINSIFLDKIKIYIKTIYRNLIKILDNTLDLKLNLDSDYIELDNYLLLNNTFKYNDIVYIDNDDIHFVYFIIEKYLINYINRSDYDK